MLRKDVKLHTERSNTTQGQERNNREPGVQHMYGASNNFSEVFAREFPSLDGLFNLYELTSGWQWVNETDNFTITSPALYLTNLTYDLTADQLMYNLSAISTDVEYALRNKEPFIGGVVAVALVLCGIVTAAWMLFLLLLLSSNSIPNSLIISNLFFCATYTVILAKFTDDLQEQVRTNVADTEMVRQLTYATGIIIVRSISSFFIWLSWIDLSIQLYKYVRKSLLITVGLMLSFMSIAFGMSFFFIHRNFLPVEPSYTAVKVLHYTIEYLILILFFITVLHYSWRKRAFAYHRKAMALAVFCLITLISPLVFLTIDIISEKMRTWTTFVFSFTKLCVTVAIWEWLHAIRKLESGYEKKAVLGRRISNDSFAETHDDMEDDDVQSDNTYIFKTINIVSISAALKSPIHLMRRLQLPKPGIKKEASRDELRLYELAPATSRISNLSQQTGVSIEAQHPQFNVDPRYLRNTPSTFHRDTANPTPISVANSNDDIYTHNESDTAQSTARSVHIHD